MIAPKISVSEYSNKCHTERNQKTSYSITVQGMINSRGVFSDVCIEWPGAMPDDHVMEKSTLFQRASRGKLKDVWIVGNSGHPLMDWVLVPYTNPNLMWTQHAFNEKIEEIKGVTKQAFVGLKVLHNICEMRNEEMDDEWRFEIFDYEIRSAASMQARDHFVHHSD